MGTLFSRRVSSRIGFDVPPVFRISEKVKSVVSWEPTGCHWDGTISHMINSESTSFAHRFYADVPESPGNGTVWGMAIGGDVPKNPGLGTGWNMTRRKKV